jgi:hypothetical protein
MTYNENGILKKLYSENDELVIELLDKLEPNIQKSIVPALIDLLGTTKSHKVKHKLALIFHDLKDQRVLPALVKEIFRPYNKNYRGPLVYACEVFDCSQYISDFLKLTVDDNYEVAMTSVLVIENMKGPFEKNELFDYVEYLEEQFGREELLHKEFVKDALEHLKKVA